MIFSGSLAAGEDFRFTALLDEVQQVSVLC